MTSSASRTLLPSLVKKYLMAVTGLVLALFVFGHMLGNMQFFFGPDVINAYAFQLHTLPFHSLYAIRAFLLVCVVVHVVMAVLLVQENRRARPVPYDRAQHRASTLSAKLMPVSGIVLLAYIIFHLMHFTLRVGPGEYANAIGTTAVDVGHGEKIMFFDVYAMMAKGFQHVGTSLFYIVAVGLLCVHLTHGFSSMFQTLGIRNEKWRYRLNTIAQLYGWVVFLGFASVPGSVLLFGLGHEYSAEVDTRIEMREISGESAH